MVSPKNSIFVHLFCFCFGSKGLFGDSFHIHYYSYTANGQLLSIYKVPELFCLQNPNRLKYCGGVVCAMLTAGPLSWHLPCFVQGPGRTNNMAHVASPLTTDLDRLSLSSVHRVLNGSERSARPNGNPADTKSTTPENSLNQPKFKLTRPYGKEATGWSPI